MAKKKKESGSVKRFGTRYGRGVKERIGKIEKLRNSKHICPYCHQPKVIRLAAGIWKCRKCSAKFASKAYFVEKRSVSQPEAVGTSKPEKDAQSPEGQQDEKEES